MAATGSCINPTELATFFQFLQCQLRMEAHAILHSDVQLRDPEAVTLWEAYKTWVRTSPSGMEKWMPYHTVLGMHELFILTSVRFKNKKRTFMAMFIFRSTCQPDMFDEVLRPFLEDDDFWENPVKRFRRGGEIFEKMLAYRKNEGGARRSLQTSSYRCIPRRLLEDNDENLVLNICKRTQTLLKAALEVWPILKDCRPNKFERISEVIQQGRGLGETWSKMLCVSIDIMFPHTELLCNQCDVGVGALPGLQRIVKVKENRAKAALRRLTKAINSSTLPSATHFRAMLPEVEELARQRYRDHPGVLSHMESEDTTVTASTVQVQLCEWRQFLDHIKRASTAVARSASVPRDRTAISRKDNGEVEESSRKRKRNQPRAQPQSETDDD